MRNGMGRYGLRSLRAGGGLPVPAVADPWAWFRADWANGTQNPPPEGNLAQWNDISGNGRHVSQSGDFKPDFSLNQQNGLPAVSFVRSNSDRLESTHSHTGAWSFVAVLNCTDVTAGNNILSGAHASDNSSFFIAQTTGRAAIWGGSGSIEDADGSVEDTWRICAGVVNGASSKITRGDGTATSGTPTGGGATQNFSLGAGNSPFDAFFNGLLGEAIVYNSALSDAELNALATDMKNRWNATWTNL